MIKIYVPHHVSGIWIPYYSSNPLETGSIGIGVNLAIYLETTLKDGDCKILLNDTPVLEDQAKEICIETGMSLTTRAISPFKLGSGFGLSAALIMSHSLLTHMVSKRPLFNALQKAHEIEVKWRTGLGDVIAEYTGGLAIRVKPGAPGIGIAYRLLAPEVSTLIVGELGYIESTANMLERIPGNVYEEGRLFLKEIMEKEDPVLFFEYSRRFTSKIFCYDCLKKDPGSIKGVIGYYLKKSALIMWIEEEYADEIIESMKINNIKLFKTRISHHGVVVVYTPKSPKEREPADQGETGRRV
ncbi:MAG: kinase [Desulfurococcaceae archaeon]